MTGKEYLSQYKTLQGTIDRLEKDLKTAEDKRDAISLKMDGMPHGTDISRRTENLAIRITDLRQRIKDAIDESEAVQNEIKLVIEGIGKGKSQPWKWNMVREVLTAIYLNSYDRKSRYNPTPFTTVEEKIHVHRNTVYRYHKLGIEVIENEILKGH